MRKHSTLTLASSGAQQQLERGKLDIGKGKKCVGLRLKTTVTVANASGGAVTLSDTQKQNLLSSFILNLDYGGGGAFKPFQSVDFKRLNRLSRFAYGSEIEGYSDSVTGLAQAMSNSTSYAMTFYPVIPLGKLWFLRELQNQMGLGRSGMRSLQFTIRRLDQTIVSGVTITASAATFEIIPDLVSCEGDQFGIVPHWHEIDEGDKTVRTPEGFPLLVTERTFAHASTSLTNISAWVGEEELHDQVSPGEIVTEYNDAALVPAAGSLTDRETVIYVVNDTQALKYLPTGSVRITQNVKDLTTFKLGLYYVPVASSEDLEATVRYVASTLRNKTVRMVSLRRLEGRTDLPTRLQPFFGFRFVDTDDKEIEKFGGLQASPGSPAMAVVPAGVREAAKGVASLHKRAGETKAVDDVAQTVAADIPGAVQSSKGFDDWGGTPILRQVRSEVS